MISHKKCYKLFPRDFFAFKNRLQRDVKASSGKINELLNFANRWSLGKQTNHSPLFVRWEWLINWKFVFTFPSLFAVPPTVKAVNQLVAAPVESHVLLQCIVEAFAKPLNTWYRNEGIVFHHPASDSTGDDGMEISLSPARLPRFQFTQMTWTFFFSLSHLPHLLTKHTPPQPSTNSISRQFIPPLRSICHELFTTNQPPQTRSCITEKNILLPSQCLIHLHGKWI